MDIFLVKKHKLITALLCIFLYGCGYTTHSILPSGESSLYVDNFINRINVTEETSDAGIYYAYRPGMEADITREVIDRFIFDGNFVVKDRQTAHFLLKGELVDFKRDPLRYNGDENVVEYRVRVIVDIEFYDLKEDKVIWREKNFAGESTYRTTGQFAKSESTALKEATKDLARRVVERTVENW